MALGGQPVCDLLVPAGQRQEVHEIGDRVSARTVEEAVLEGLKVGSRL
jgi:hypothetical protein